MRVSRLPELCSQLPIGLAALGLLLLAPAPAGAQVRRVTLGLHTTCPYGLVA